MTTPLALRLRMVITVLALLGLLVSTYLALYETKASSSLACPDSGCERVNKSPYVYMFGVPIAVIGMGGYGLLFLVGLGNLKEKRLLGVPVGLILLAMSGLGFLFSLFLTYLELFEIRAICTWCMVSFGLITASAILSAVAWFAERAKR